MWYRRCYWIPFPSQAFPDPKKKPLPSWLFFFPFVTGLDIHTRSQLARCLTWVFFLFNTSHTAPAPSCTVQTNRGCYALYDSAYTDRFVDSRLKEMSGWLQSSMLCTFTFLSRPLCFVSSRLVSSRFAPLNARIPMTPNQYNTHVIRDGESEREKICVLINWQKRQLRRRRLPSAIVVDWSLPGQRTWGANPREPLRQGDLQFAS